MLIEVAKDIYKKIVPLPNNPLREINVYFILGKRNLMIDTGFHRPECEQALQSAITELGIGEYDVFISHFHSDHCGLISKFAKAGCTALAGEVEGELINFETGNLYWKLLDDIFIKYGFPKANFGRNTDIHPGRKYGNLEKVDFTYVKEGDVLAYGQYRFQPILTPGHTPGHMCLYDAEKKILFCGDHILGTITPNISIELGVENPLQDYLNSLRKIAALDIDLVLTSHGTMINDVYERIRELYRHHEERLLEVAELLTDKWKTAYMVAKDMKWETMCKDWESFPPAQKWFATGEAISHLQYLYFSGIIFREERDGIYYYRK